MIFCIRCVMNSNVDKNIEFDDKGICNHCRRYDLLSSTRLSFGNASLDKIIRKIKKSGHNREYDCLIGVSGGVDSTYVAYLTKKFGLRPLAVHLDNGWNSELAVANIRETLHRLNIDLVTHVLNWSDFKELQKAFLRADVPDGEVPTDHAIFALMWKEATKRNIRYIISGMNFQTESISVSSWSYGHSDWHYIKSVNKIFGLAKLKDFPHFSLSYLCWVNIIRRIRTVSLLNYIQYDKKHVMKILEHELGWRNYGGKHHESIYTRFYQGILLPKKFNIDKRFGHFSDLINSGQISRKEALNSLKQEPYPSYLQDQDLKFVSKKLDMTLEEMTIILNREPRSFNEYPNNKVFFQFMKKIIDYLRKYNLYPK
jgi:N-acetyl sugar amidotransferase